MLKSKHEAGEDSIVFMHLDTRSIPLLYQKGCKAAVARCGLQVLCCLGIVGKNYV